MEQSEQVKEDRKVQCENMRLKKQVKALQERVAQLEKFIGGQI
mgnify:CR=1 FL=1|jgi:hypothetical protein